MVSSPVELLTACEKGQAHQAKVELPSNPEQDGSPCSLLHNIMAVALFNIFLFLICYIIYLYVSSVDDKLRAKLFDTVYALGSVVALVLMLKAGLLCFMSGFGSYDPNRISRWYFGGIASSMAVFISHPLDLMKVLKQTQAEKLPMLGITRKIIKADGVLAFYNGISASMLRQYTYTLTRFGIYTVGQTYIDTKSMGSKVLLAGGAGFVGGFVGTPGDLINVRLQNDVKLPPSERRNYKHAFDGLARVCREEGWTTLFNGASLSAVFGMFMTIGQIAFYEETKDVLISYGFKQSLNTYILAALVSSITATSMTQPIDVVKTRRMNAAPGEYSGNSDVIFKTAKEGPKAFFKGFLPTLMRIGPHTVVMFLTLEFIRSHFGYLREDKN